jgi:hypothetical protein
VFCNCSEVALSNEQLLTTKPELGLIFGIGTWFRILFYFLKESGLKTGFSVLFRCETGTTTKIFGEKTLELGINWELTFAPVWIR